jgi:hypothetical protein
MKHFDVIVIGSGVAAMTSAAYLSKRLRNVALFVLNDETKIMSRSKTYADKNRKRYKFEVPYYEFGGLEKDELLSYYLTRLGMDEKFKVVENKETILVKQNGRIISRPNDFNGFKLFLVRHYPKSRDAIHEFFNTLSDYYIDYKNQRMSRLRGKVFTLNALTANWGGKALKEVLKDYFKDINLMQEFTYMHHTVGLDLDAINAVHYFVRWFNIFMEKSYFIQNTYEEINQLFIQKNNHETIFNDDTIKEVIIDNNKITKIIDKNDEFYTADFYIINGLPELFIDQYIKEDKGFLIEKLPSVFKSRKDKIYKNTAMIGLNKPLNELGLSHVKYVFEVDLTKEVPLLSMINYSYISPNSTAKNYGTLLIEFIDKGDVDETLIIEALSKYIDKGKEAITLVRFGEKVPYFGSQNDFFKSHKTLNDLYNLDQYKPLHVFDNAYFVGSFYRPESGVTGLLQMGVEVGDLVDDALDNLELDMPLVSHDELINMIAHQFTPKGLGDKEKYIAFIIGKSSYTIRAKGKYLEIYRYINNDYDLLLSATNETFYQLVAKDLTLEDVKNSNNLEILGDETLIEPVFKAFALGKKRRGKTYEKNQKEYGMMFFYLTMFIFTMFAILSFYVPLTLLIPITVGLSLIKIGLQLKIVREITLFDGLLILLWMVWSVFSWTGILMRWLNIETFLAFITLYWFLTWLIKKPIIYDYVYKDYRSDYAMTPFFNTMMGGLSFIWMLTLGVGFISTYYLEGVNQTIGFYTVLIAFYLTHRYPSMYVRSTIKNRK